MECSHGALVVVFAGEDFSAEDACAVFELGGERDFFHHGEGEGGLFGIVLLQLDVCGVQEGGGKELQEEF